MTLLWFLELKCHFRRITYKKMHLSAFFLKVIFLSAQLVVCKMFWLTLRAWGKWISLSDVLERSLILQLHSTYCLHCRSDCTRCSHNGIKAFLKFYLNYSTTMISRDFFCPFLEVTKNQKISRETTKAYFYEFCNTPLYRFWSHYVPGWTQLSDEVKRIDKNAF